jgi:hypothetical protein
MFNVVDAITSHKVSKSITIWKILKCLNNYIDDCNVQHIDCFGVSMYNKRNIAHFVLIIDIDLCQGSVNVVKIHVNGPNAGVPITYKGKLSGNATQRVYINNEEIADGFLGLSLQSFTINDPNQIESCTKLYQLSTFLK